MKVRSVPKSQAARTKFADTVARFEQKAPERAHEVTLKIAFELFRSVINTTPVDTGRLRGNWQAGLNAKQERSIAKSKGRRPWMACAPSLTPQMP